MTAALAAGCGAIGLVVGAGMPVVIERGTTDRPFSSRPFPEIGRWLHAPRGWAVVVLTGALFAALALRLGDTWALPAFLLLAAALVALSVIDLQTHLLPNRIVLPLTVVSIVLLAIAAIAESDGEALFRALASAVVAFLVFTMLHLFSPRAMGFGDVKLVFVLGLYLGWLGAGEVALGLLLGFIYGAVVGLALIATKVRGRKDHVPFGPFLAAGTITAILVGETILDWYRR